MKRVFLFMFFMIVCNPMSLASLEEEGLLLSRERMVREQIEHRGIIDQRVLDAMRKVDRHLLVPSGLRARSYEDRPLPIGHGQTISQPYIVAYMTEAAKVEPGDRVLEIGTGSGYQAAVLAEIVKEVYTIEIVQALGENARQQLHVMGYQNIKVKIGDGYQGWEEFAPFDVIIVTAAPPEIPEALKRQLKVGGRMVVPVGTFYQELYRVTRTEFGFTKEILLPVRFVPMVHPR